MTPGFGRQNVIICAALTIAVAIFVLFVFNHGCWRNHKAKKAERWKDYLVNGCVSQLYEGGNLMHPLRTTSYLGCFVARRILFAVIIVYLYDWPVTQLLSMIALSLIFSH